MVERCPSINWGSEVQCELDAGHDGFCRVRARHSSAEWPTCVGLEEAKKRAAEEAAESDEERAA